MIVMALFCATISAASPGTEAKKRRTTVPLYAKLGTYRRAVTTRDASAQKYITQGLCFLFAFNHDEAIRSFQQAAELDPNCAMAWWGIAIANGPHINNPAVPQARAKAAWDALQKARALAEKASPVEQALIGALEKRHAENEPADRQPLNLAYAEAMRAVWKAFPQDADVGALFAEAMMDLRPWDLWLPDGTPQPGTEEIVATLETVLRLNPKHPLGNHLYIHAVEASLHPEKADEAADRLRNLQPGLGHMVHMPSHIDVRRGRWKEAVLANDKAIAADQAYERVRARQGFYRLYMAHNYHMLAYAAMMQGESKRALEAIDLLVQRMPSDWMRENPMIADGFVAMPLEVRMRFGRWDEILAAPEPPDYLPIARALRVYARGVAQAAKGETSQARLEQKRFLDLKQQVPADAVFGNNMAKDLMAVAENVLEGEILYREGKVEEGLSALRRAVQAEDQLRYDEPPDWILPVRHALGAALMTSGQFAEAEQVFREDLKKLPENGWALYGLMRSLERQNKTQEAQPIKARFDRVWKNADIQLSSSCLCLPGI
jgi:tetratricopeptide (TPR) repeat protein